MIIFSKKQQHKPAPVSGPAAHPTSPAPPVMGKPPSFVFFFPHFFFAQFAVQSHSFGPPQQMPVMGSSRLSFSLFTSFSLSLFNLKISLQCKVPLFRECTLRYSQSTIRYAERGDKYEELLTLMHLQKKSNYSL